MCYGDIAYGRDGYYEKWAREQNEEKELDDAIERAQFEADRECEDDSAQ